MPPVPVISTRRFGLNPYSVDINPLETQGSKLYQTATKSRENDAKLAVKLTNAKKFLDSMKKDATKFCWGRLTANIKVKCSVYDILKDFLYLSVAAVWFMCCIYSDPLATTLHSGPNPVMFPIDPDNDNSHKVVFY